MELPAELLQRVWAQGPAETFGNELVSDAKFDWVRHDKRCVWRKRAEV